MTEKQAIEQFKERLAIEDYKQQIPEYYEAMELAVKSLEEIQKYHEIGTPDECWEAVEKQRAKKPIIECTRKEDSIVEIEWKCPKCGAKYIELAPCGEWCRYCGTKFDWSDEE